MFDPGGVSMMTLNSETSCTGKNDPPTIPRAGSAMDAKNVRVASVTIDQRYRSAHPIRRLYPSAWRLNHALNRSSQRLRNQRCSVGTWGSGQYADSIGSSENETNSDTSTEHAMVSAKGANHCSASPPMNATGTNTTTIENVVAATARPISLVPSCAAVTWSLPISTCRTMFSRTTIASSIRMPMASDRPSSDIVFSVKPNSSTAMNDAMTEIGSAMPVMTVDRHELRNRNTTSTVSTAPSTSAYSTSPTDCATRTPASRTMRSDVPGGRVDCSLPASSRIAWATAVVL